MYVLHGLLGSARNWASFVKDLSARLPQASIISLDLRNHGQSAGFASPHSLDAAAEDVLSFARAKGMSPSAIVGHSLGGKVAMHLVSRAGAELAARAPEDALKNVWVLDSMPGLRPSGSSPPAAAPLDSVERVLRLVKSIPTPIPSRSFVVEVAEREGLDRGTALWLASNVAVASGGAASAAAPAGEHRWSFDPQTAAALYASYCELDCWPLLVEGPPAGIDVDVVIATKSSRWNATRDLVAAATANSATANAAARGRVRFHSLVAGHWLHVDNPSGLLALMAPQLSNLK